MGKSYIADDIMKEYRRKKRYEENKKWSELQDFTKNNCIDCKNKNTNLCEIRRNLEGFLQCVNKE